MYHRFHYLYHRRYHRDGLAALVRLVYVTLAQSTEQHLGAGGGTGAGEQTPYTSGCKDGPGRY